MSKSTGFFISMVIFVIGVISVIASMVLGGLDEIDMSVIICQTVTVLCMVGLLALKLGKAEKCDQKDEEFFIEQDDDFDDDDEEEEDGGAFYSDDTNDEYIVHGKFFSDNETEENSGSISQEEENTAELPEEIPVSNSFEEPPHQEIPVEEADELDLEVPDFEEESEQEEPQMGLFKQAEFVDEPDFSIEADSFNAPEEIAAEPQFPTAVSDINAEPAEAIDELKIDMDPLIEQVFEEQTETMPEEPEVEEAPARKRLILKVVGVRRVRNYSVPLPKKIKLKK